MTNEAVATDESFDLVHHVQPWSYDLPLICCTEASLVALAEPVHHHVPPPHTRAAIMALHSTGQVMMGRRCYCCLSIASRLKNNCHSKASYC